MFETWSIKKIFATFGLMLLVVATVQVYMFFMTQSIVIHFSLSFVALFIALLLFHSVNIKIKNRRKK